jgi:hypothetical protein
MRFKKHIVMVLILSFLFNFTYTAFASDNLLQTHYVTPSSDNIKVKAVIEKLFSARLNDFKDSEIDYSTFFTDKRTNKDTKYFIDKQTFTKALYKREGIDKKSMDIELTFGDITINDSMAIVELYEWFSFMYKNGNGLPSGMGNRYKITLIKINGDWKVETIISNDEFDEQYYVKGFNLEVLQDELKKPLQIIYSTPKTEYSYSAPSILSLSLTSYNASSAASYAYSYAKSDSYNSKFASFSSDCQNFASQCVWFGLGGSNTTVDISNGAWPMSSGWYQKGPGNESAYAWINVDGFASLIAASGPTVSSPYGIINNGIASAKKGDILQYNDSADPTDYVHSYVVYSVTGTEGSRNFSNFYVCAHTRDRQNVQLSTIWSDSSVSRFRTINILGRY